MKNVFRGVWVNNAKRKTWAVWSVCYTFQLPAARFSYFCTEMHREGTERGFKGAKLYHFLIDKNKWLLTNTKSMFVSVIHDGVLGPPRLDCHDWWCPCLEATFKAMLRAIEGRRQLQKALHRPQSQTGELLGGRGEQSYSPPSKSNILYLTGPWSKLFWALPVLQK